MECDVVYEQFVPVISDELDRIELSRRPAGPEQRRPDHREVWTPA